MSNKAIGSFAVVLLAFASGCCFGGGGIPENPPSPPGYVSGPTYAHCITQTTPFNRCTERANTGPTSSVGRLDPTRPQFWNLIGCGNPRAQPGECPAEGRVGACISASGEVRVIDYSGGPQPDSWDELERQCTSLGASWRYVRAAGVQLGQ